jgi:hypothetical protein
VVNDYAIVASRSISTLLPDIAIGSATWPGGCQLLAVPFCVPDRSDEGRMRMSAPEPVTGERADLLQSMARQRHFLRYTTRGLTDEQVDVLQVVNGVIRR